MAFPTVEGVGTLTQATNSASHNVPYPTVSGGILAGDLLIAFGALDTSSSAITNWNGFTEISSGLVGSTQTNAWVGCAYKWATGGETGTVTFTNAIAEHGTWSMLCIRGADTATNPEGSTGVPNPGSSSADPDPDSLTPSWGADDTLWFAFEGCDSTASPTAPPTNYTDESTVPADGTSGAGHSVASRQLNAASEDPGTFTMAAEQWRAMTVAVKPAPSGTVVSVGQASETNTAQAIAKKKTRAAGQATETDTAQTIKRVSAYALAVDVKSPTSHWPLGEASGNAIDRKGVHDLSPSAGGLTRNVAGLVVNNGGDGAAAFDGSTGYLAAGSSTTYDTTTFTLSATIKPTTAVTGVQQTVIDNAGVFPDQHSGLSVDTDGTVVAYFQATTGVYAIVNGATVLTDGQTHRITCSYDGTTFRVFLDGVLDGSFTPAVADKTPKTTNSAHPLYVGKANDSTRFFGGTIDEVQVFPSALTAAEDLTIFQAGSAAGHTITVNQAIETDTAQAITKLKRHAVGQAPETDTAQAFARAKALALGQATETDTAQPVAKLKRHAVAQAAETDTAQPVARRKTRAVGQATETDTAQPVARAKRRTVGQAAETDIAQPIAHGAHTIAVGQATETDTAQPVARRKTRAVGQTVETDTAQPVARAKRRAVSQATEADTAQPVVRRKTRAVGQAVETDTAQPIATPTGHQVGQTVETDTAQPFGRSKVKLIGEAGDGTIYPGNLPGGVLPGGSATEFAETITPVKSRTLGQATETDTAQPITRATAVLPPTINLPTTVALGDGRAIAAVVPLSDTVTLEPLNATVALMARADSVALTAREGTVAVVARDDGAAIVARDDSVALDPLDSTVTIDA